MLRDPATGRWICGAIAQRFFCSGAGLRNLRASFVAGLRSAGEELLRVRDTFCAKKCPAEQDGKSGCGIRTPFSLARRPFSACEVRGTLYNDMHRPGTCVPGFFVPKIRIPRRGRGEMWFGMRTRLA